MPQVTKGGKYIFGWSIVGDTGLVALPAMAVEEYSIDCEQKVVLFTGSKKTGGFCVTRVGLLQQSPIPILNDHPELESYQTAEGTFFSYKGRKYGWVSITKPGLIQLTKEMMDVLQISPGTKLLSIRGSCYAFVMGARGPLLERAENYDGDIEVFNASYNEGLPTGDRM